MIDKDNFSMKLIKQRNICGISQKRLSEMLCISPQAVSKWERGISMPDIEFLSPLSQIFGVSIDCLLDNKSDKIDAIIEDAVLSDNLIGFDITDSDKVLLSGMSEFMSRKTLYKAAKMMEQDKLSYGVSLNINAEINGEECSYNRKIDINDINDIKTLGKSLASLTLQAVHDHKNPVADIIDIMICPTCSSKFEYSADENGEKLTCGEHDFRITEGVVDFNTLEKHGNMWSNWLRSYEDYETMVTEGMKIIRASKRGRGLGEMLYNMIDKIIDAKPSVILEMGCGMGSFANELLKHINWECTYILNDISYRILKYDRRYMLENCNNAYVDLVFLSCNANKLPIKDNSIDCVISCGGFQNMLDEFNIGIIESRRILNQMGKMVFNLSLVDDIDAEPTKKWLELLRNWDDSDAETILNMVYDINEWNNILKDVIGFSNHELIKMADESSPPDTDKYPYDHEVMRWMAEAVVTASK